jgi:RNA polymerase sigma factor (sigma-70 family)
MIAYSPWPDLFARLLAGSADAAAEVVARRGRLVEHVVRRHLPRWAHRVIDVEDMVQEVWLGFFAEKCCRLCRERRCLPGLLCKLARDRARDARRRLLAHKRGGGRVVPLPDCAASELLRLQEPRPGPADQATGRELWQALFDTEPGAVRSIVQMRLCGLPLDQVAEELELSLSTVKRVLVRLQQRWQALAR